MMVRFWSGARPGRWGQLSDMTRFFREGWEVPRGRRSSVRIGDVCATISTDTYGIKELLPVTDIEWSDATEQEA